MSQIIGYSSLHLEQKHQFICVPEVNLETLFALDKTIREVAEKNPSADFSAIEAALIAKGASKADKVSGGVYIHARPWDEHLTKSNKSFFVTFTDDSPEPLAGNLFLATNYPSYYAMMAIEYVGLNKFVLINEEHDPIYPDDELVLSDEGDKSPIGTVEVIREQFHSDESYESARQFLKKSGYAVL